MNRYWQKLADVVAYPNDQVVTILDSGVPAQRYYRLATPRLED